MNEKEKRKDEILQELSVRFRDSANAMKSIAARIQAAASQSLEQGKRLKSEGEPLRQCVECGKGPLPFSYLEFLEFSDVSEFEKYKDMPIISDSDIKNVNFDDLTKKLQA